MDESLELGASGHAAADVRAWLDDLGGLRVLGQSAFDARLLVTELVSNSVRHAGVRPSEQIRVNLSLRDSVLRVEVVDPGEGFAMEERRTRRLGPGGRGLLLVDAISSRWGVLGRRPFTTWFEIDLPAAAHAPLGRDDGAGCTDARERGGDGGPRASCMRGALRWRGLSVATGQGPLA